MDVALGPFQTSCYRRVGSLCTETSFVPQNSWSTSIFLVYGLSDHSIILRVCTPPKRVRPISNVVLLPCRTKLIELNSTLAHSSKPLSFYCLPCFVLERKNLKTNLNKFCLHAVAEFATHCSNRHGALHPRSKV